MEDKEKRETKEFINNLLKNSKLTIEYFDIYYAKKIHQEMFEILKNNLEYFNKISSISNKDDFLINEESKNLFGFTYLENDLVFYCQNNKTLEQIFRKSNTLIELMESYGITEDLLTYTSNTSYENKKSKSDKEELSEIYNEGKFYEYISLERFNYYANLKNNLLCLIPMPNIIFYLIPLEKMKLLEKITDKKKIREELNYKTDKYGYNELDGIYINDINLDVTINNFENYKIMKSFKINNKIIEELQIKEGSIKPYSNNFIEIKSSFKFLKEKNQIINFLKKCLRFIFIFNKLKINQLEKPKLYDYNVNDNNNFPKNLCYDLFFIIDNDAKDFDKYSIYIKEQIKTFIEKKDFNFDFQLYFSSKTLSNNEIESKHNSRINETNSILFNYNKLNFYYEKKMNEIENQINDLKNQLKKNEKINAILIYFLPFFIILVISFLIIKK